MKCERCNGTGRILEPFGNRTIPSGCPICNGTGILEQTNEEWFCSLSTEEKAEWLTDFVSKQNKNRLEWYWWLKQPHTTIKE